MNLSLAELANPPKGRSSIYYTWCDRILTGVFTKGQCNQWAKAVVPLAEGQHPSGKRTNLTHEEAADLVERLRIKGGVDLTPEHTEQGVAYLRSYGASRIGLPQEAIDNFDHFVYMGEAHDNGYTWPSAHVPIWHFVTKDDQEFAYYVVAWQTGQDSSWCRVR